MKKLTFLLFGLIALVACEAELETEKSNGLADANRITRSGLTISPEEAAAQALEFRESILNQSGQTRGKKDKKGVASVYAWRLQAISPKAMTRSTASDLLPDTLLYIVNFEDSCGYALVSADALVPGVAAYVEKGTLTPDQEIDNPGFKIFLDGYGKYITDSIKKMSDSIKIHQYDSLIAFMDTIHAIPEPYSEYRLVYQAGPLLTTKWRQEDPYNFDCPIFDPEHNGHCKAGCVAIAIGQVAAYYRYPTTYNGQTYNWDAILSDSYVHSDNIEASENVARLIHDIGILVQMIYDRSASSAPFDSISICLNTFGYHYTYVKNQETNFNAIIEDIENGHPVIMMGTKIANDRGGHAWVVDGVAVKRHRLANFYSIPDREYIHCNWGEGGLCNGYFILGAFQNRWNIETDLAVTGLDAIHASNYAFNYKNYAYHHIYPIIN